MSRYLGQHFLINKKKLEKIASALKLKDGDIVIEIGPGHGELTQKIRQENKNCKIIMIEKDNKLVQILKQKFLNDKNTEIIEGDALKEVKNQISKIAIYFFLNNKGQKSKIIENLKIVGNIPYYITGYLFRILGELENKPSSIVFLIQKEVAERICATPPKMNLLAASIQFWAEPKIISYVSRKDFNPPPKVESAIIKLTTYDQRFATNNAEKYYQFIRILFKQPRKTILNNLASEYKNKEKIIKILQKIGIDSGARSQNLTIEQISALSTLF